MKTKKTLITITTSLIALLIVTTVTYAINPTLTPSSTPGTDTQYSLNDIYNKLTDFSTTTDDGTGLFTTPPEVTAQFATLSDIYGLLEDEDDLVEENIRDGVTIFGLVGSLLPGGVTKTGATTTYATGDDGNIQAGIAMSKTVVGDTVVDNTTGLIWQRDGGYRATGGWSDALTYCNTLTLAGSSDWRLPNIKELLSILDFGVFPLINSSIFTNTINAPWSYWSSTPYSHNSFNSWKLDDTGVLSLGDKSGGSGYVRCVR